MPTSPRLAPLVLIALGAAAGTAMAGGLTPVPAANLKTPVSRLPMFFLPNSTCAWWPPAR